MIPEEYGHTQLLQIFTEDRKLQQQAHKEDMLFLVAVVIHITMIYGCTFINKVYYTKQHCFLSKNPNQSN